MTQPAAAGSRLTQIAPALLGATSFACADVLAKVALNAGADVLTLTSVRGVLGLALLTAWLRLGTRLVPLTPRVRWIALGVGVLFAGNVFLIFLAIERVEVPIAILTYFVYPLLTGIAIAATGVEPLSWRGATAALAAFFGLALMIGAHPVALAAAGIIAALAAACCRVAMLMVMRVYLQGVDARLITWYSLVSSTVAFVIVSLLTQSWQPPTTMVGWIALGGLAITTTTGILGVFASTGRIGPFRTALFMNLEPLLATIGSAVLLGEWITPLQAVGGAVMIAALVAFQLRR